jgi:hypothetical protein
MHRCRRREHGATFCNGRTFITSTERVQSMTFVVDWLCGQARFSRSLPYFARLALCSVDFLMEPVPVAG